MKILGLFTSLVLALVVSVNAHADVDDIPVHKAYPAHVIDASLLLKSYAKDGKIEKRYGIVATIEYNPYCLQKPDVLVIEPVISSDTSEYHYRVLASREAAKFDMPTCKMLGSETQTIVIDNFMPNDPHLFAPIYVNDVKVEIKK